MSPVADVVDLTQNSDDDSQSNNTQTRPNSQLASSAGRKSRVNHVKQSPRVSGTFSSQRSQTSFTGQTERQPSTNGQQTPSKPRDYDNGQSRDVQKVATPSLQHKNGFRDHRLDSTSKGSPTVMKDSRNGGPDTIHINVDEEDEASRPKFQMPRGLNGDDSHGSSGPKRTLGSPLDADTRGGPKRPLEIDSPRDIPAPAKRRKIDPASSSQDLLSQKSKVTSLAQRSDKESSGLKPKRSSNTIDLTSSPDAVSRPRPSHLFGQDHGASSRNKKPKKVSHLKNGNPDTASASRKAVRDSLIAIDSDAVSQGSRTSQHSNGVRHSLYSQDTTLEPSELLNGRQRRKGDEEASGIVNGHSSPNHAAEASHAKHKKRPRRSAEPQENGSMAFEQSNGYRVPSEPNSKYFMLAWPRSRKAEKNSARSPNAPLRTPDRSEQTSRGRDPSKEQRDDDPQEVSRSNKDVESETFSGLSYPPGTTRMSSLDEDQGYVSLSSGKRDHSREDAERAGTDTSRVSQSRKKIVTPISTSKAARKEFLDLAKTNRDESDGINGIDKHLSAQKASAKPANNKPSSDDERTATEEASNRTPTSRKIASHLKNPDRLEREDGGLAKSAEASRVGSSSVANKLGEDVEEEEPLDAEASGANKTLRKQASTVAEEADLQLRSEAMQGIGEDEIETEPEEHPPKPKTAPAAMKPPSVYANLPLANQVEKVLGKYLEELQGDNEYWTSVAMAHARLSREEEKNHGLPNAAKIHSEIPTSFSHLQPLELLPHQKAKSSAKPDQLWGIERMQPNGKPLANSTFLTSYKTFSTDAQDLPNYAHYVSIKSNILAPNATNLHYWPYFDDDFDMSQADSLHDQYNIDIEPRERKLLLLLKAQKYEEYVESALQDLGCSWSDVLRFLLETNPDVGRDLDARKALQNRPQYCEEDFRRTTDRAAALLTALPPSTPEKLGRTAVLCEDFQKMAKFSLWHVARRSDCATLPEKAEAPAKAQPSDNDITCRICLRFNCPYHGEFKERPDDSESDGEFSSVIDSVVATDIVHPQKANYRSRVEFPPALPDASESNEDPRLRSKKDVRYWQTGNHHHKADERGPFYPCYHPGSSCEEADCSCNQNRIPCEKICSCAQDCPRKFKGCSCSVEKVKKGHKGTCFEDERCVCYQLGRECDPDLCGGCGVCDAIDPVNKYNGSILAGRCRNASIQRGVPKHTLLGDSGVHGLGLYACEEIQENDFVGEYKGEIITKEEADRRGAVYEFQKLSYLFSLNATQEIDSTYFGNKVRFINHAGENKANLYPRIIMVNTVHRIALYARCKIRVGQEMLFDYGPKFPDEQLGGKKSKKSAPHVRNANLVREFLDVEQKADAQGNIRAKGVAWVVASKAKQKKPRARGRPSTTKKPLKTKPQRSTTPVHDEDESGSEPEQNAGERLAAFNISDDHTSDAMDVDVEAGAEDDEPFEPEEFDSEESDESDLSERSEMEDEDDEEPSNGRPRRGGVGTRSWRFASR